MIAQTMPAVCGTCAHRHATSQGCAGHQWTDTCPYVGLDCPEPVARIEPGGCRWCGWPQRQHYTRWNAKWSPAGVGFHQWVAPSDEQRLARMKARRAARQRPEVSLP